jgi:hypothetical protein
MEEHENKIEYSSKAIKTLRVYNSPTAVRGPILRILCQWGDGGFRFELTKQFKTMFLTCRVEEEPA